MTDLNKEREAFIQTEFNTFGLDVNDFKTTGEYFMFIGWLMRSELEKAKAQAVPEKKIYLTCEQLYAAANFGAPNKDPELLETELTIAWFDEAHSGSGYYVYISEYPEEGAMKLESESGAEG
ncbi:hypothetical protein ACT4ZS_15080 [Acinetobacter baumannii]